MTITTRNLDFREARRAKKDEFYTSLRDIELELQHYTDHFAGKVVYCNCDDPRASDGTAQPVEEKEAWRSLAKTWDDVLFPQLEDRYSGRPEQLMDLLHVDTAPPAGDYAWRLRTAKGGTVEARTLAPVRVSELDIDVVKRSFRWLTR